MTIREVAKKMIHWSESGATNLLVYKQGRSWQFSPLYADSGDYDDGFVFTGAELDEIEYAVSNSTRGCVYPAIEDGDDVNIKFLCDMLEKDFYGIMVNSPAIRLRVFYDQYVIKEM